MERNVILTHIILTLIIQQNLHLISAKSCSKLTDCSCKTDGGTIIDLSSLANNDATPRFADIPDSISNTDFYSYNPCKKFTEGSCVDVSVCLVQSSGVLTQYTGIGTQDSSTFQYNDEGELTIQYSENHTISIVAIVCEEDTEGTFTPGKMGKGTYNFQLNTKHVCIQERISIGTVLCISLASVLVVYFGLGVVIQIFVRKKSGRQVVPNSSFWTAIPFLIKDGVVFVVKRGNVSSYSKL